MPHQLKSGLPKDFLTPCLLLLLPPNDGGIAYGQAAIATASGAEVGE